MKEQIAKYLINFEIKNITLDSRQVQKNDAFFAIKGVKYDGNDYINHALDKGASVIFTDHYLSADLSRNIIYIENIRSALNIASSILFDKVPANLIAVTGTNGKTSVVSYIHQILILLGQTSAAIGTIGIQSSKELTTEILKLQSNLTTYDPVVFRKLLNKMTQNSIKNLSFEASSHGLDQSRLGNIKVKSAAFTSFSQDHLEYHKTMEAYLRAKLLLFTEYLEPLAEAVISSDMPVIEQVISFLESRGIKYCTIGRNGQMQISKIIPNVKGQEVFFDFQGQKFHFKTNIIGSFQASNLLIAAKLVANLGFDFKQIIRLLPKIKSVPGRLERVTNYDDNFQIFVDYAHTPDALEKSLQELKIIKKKEGRLFVIFGCGGERDKIKRPIMGKIASQIADQVIITDDNPRHENSAIIRQEIIDGILERTIYEEIKDRKNAIMNIVAKLGKDDILLIAGKGHEDYQIIGDTTIDLSDVEIAKTALLDRK